MQKQFAVIFDRDGVLVDNFTDYQAAWKWGKHTHPAFFVPGWTARRRDV